MQELPFACKNTQGDCKPIVVPIGKWYEALPDILGNVQDSTQVQTRILLLVLVLVELADTADHQVIIVLPKCLQQSNIACVVG